VNRGLRLFSVKVTYIFLSVFVETTILDLLLQALREVP
jgi:hypothetical protein